MEDFVIIPVRLICLPAELVQLYLAIRSFDWQREGEERAGCTAKVETLAQMVDKHPRRVRANLARLVECGVIRVEYRPLQSSRIFCTPENFKGAVGSPPCREQPPRTQTAAKGGVGSRSGGRKQPVGGLSTAAEVETVNQRQEVETGSRDVAGAVGDRPAPGQQSLLPDAPSKPAKRTRKAADAAPSTAVWLAYSVAYEQRHGVAPVRNGKINRMLLQLLERIPASEAPAVAAFYVGHNSAFYAAQMHPIGLLLKDCEGLRAQWVTGTQVNATTARRNEATAANPFIQRAIDAEARERREREDVEQD